MSLCMECGTLRARVETLLGLLRATSQLLTIADRSHLAVTTSWRSTADHVLRQTERELKR